MISAAIEGDSSERHELDRAPGELQLRRRAVMLKAATPMFPGRREDVKEVRTEEGVRVDGKRGRGDAHRRRVGRMNDGGGVRSVRMVAELWWVLE